MTLRYDFLSVEAASCAMCGWARSRIGTEPAVVGVISAAAVDGVMAVRGRAELGDTGGNDRS